METLFRMDFFLPTLFNYTLFVTTKEEGRTILHWCQPISRTLAFLWATTSTRGKVAASASEITGNSSCWLSWEAEECFAKKLFI